MAINGFFKRWRCHRTAALLPRPINISQLNVKEHGLRVTSLASISCILSLPYSKPFPLSDFKWWRQAARVRLLFQGLHLNQLIEGCIFDVEDMLRAANACVSVSWAASLSLLLKCEHFIRCRRPTKLSSPSITCHHVCIYTCSSFLWLLLQSLSSP
eukprot:scaffold3263_cov83-Alexandrium_tamarense.AAC.1